MLRPNIVWALLAIIPLSVGLMALFLGSGCRKKPDIQEEIAVAAKAAPEAAPEVPAWTETFLKATKDSISDITAGGLGKLHLSGLVILVVAIAVRFLFGSWRDALYAVGLGVLPSAAAVLLADYPRVVLLVPACGLAILIALGIRKIVRWRALARAGEVMMQSVEDDDTGRHSLGDLEKQSFAAKGLAPDIDPALKIMEKKWKKQKQPPKELQAENN